MYPAGGKAPPSSGRSENYAALALERIKQDLDLHKCEGSQHNCSTTIPQVTLQNAGITENQLSEQDIYNWDQYYTTGYPDKGSNRLLKPTSNGRPEYAEYLPKSPLEGPPTSVLNGHSNKVLPGSLASKLMRKPSIERELPGLQFHRGSPALDSGAGSSRSDSPHSHSQQLPSSRTSVGQYSPSPCPSNYSDVPPLPPPRNSSTPPTPPPAPANLQILKRRSPAATARPIALPAAASTRGTSPVSGTVVSASVLQQSQTNHRQIPAPVIPQNGPKAQQQLSQQMQALSLYQSGGNSGEPPPPYPINNSGGPPPPPSYTATIQNRQSPTQSQSDYRKSPSSGIYSATSAGSPSPITVTNSAIIPSSSQAAAQAAAAAAAAMVRPQPWGAYQTRTQPPIIMQSVKSTQVQKPVLQTAIAPPPPASPSICASPVHVANAPPSYATSIQQKTQQQQQTQASPLIAGTATTGPPPPVKAKHITPPTTPPVLPSLNGMNNGNNGNGNTVPTSEPPSYAITIQAMKAAQHQQQHQQQNKQIEKPSSTTSRQLPPPPPYQLTPNSNNSLSPNSNLNINNNLEAKNLTNQQQSVNSNLNETNSNIINNNNLTTTPPIPPAKVSSSTSSLASSEKSKSSTANSKSENIRKIKHQSPIPERRKVSKEKEEERKEFRIKHYSPQAFKFFMEQHIENVMKSYKQRSFRANQLEKEMAKINLSAQAQVQMRLMLNQKESNYIRLKRAKMDKSMFVQIKHIGVGAFGEVSLVRKLDATNHLYAMKTLRKADVLKRNQVAHVKAERDILAEADNEWVVKLYYSFQDKDNLYFVMDYIPGGDLMSLLIKKGIFEEPLARFYIAELTCAVESVHKMGFIHRDIKPDNILIDRDGHIKLTDFGLCTGFRWTHNSKYYQENGDHCRQDSMEPWEDYSENGTKPTVLERRRIREHQRTLAHSLVGTPNYIAPEVLERSGYTQLCDWWSVGVILYEMLVGQPPFLANTPVETQQKVINWEKTLVIPPQAQLSREATDLIRRLCSAADKRLGKKADEVKQHDFFKGVDWSDMRKQKAPYIPKIEHPTDTSNFDPIDPDKLRASNDSNGGEFNDDTGKPFHGFFEFTFRRFFDSDLNKFHKTNTDINDDQGPVYV
ncbi:serine/threonine-protein kinase Warts [Condylostylus longicornis]|uniref:serine/threonine-protein kinase Warts n=1 Tax=Condylostylus longicornis TaxID=2530218 RepID=UPI00244DD28B|nr:serine/threonine-protein kinase Warts [Condylostylus longicornis]